MRISRDFGTSLLGMRYESGFPAFLLFLSLFVSPLSLEAQSWKSPSSRFQHLRPDDLTSRGWKRISPRGGAAAKAPEKVSLSSAARGTATAEGAPQVKKAPMSATVDLDERVHVDFHDVELRTLLRYLAERTRTNYVIDPAVTGRVNVVGPKDMSLREAMALMQSLLEQRDLTVVKVGKVHRVVPKAKAKGEPIETRLRWVRGQGDGSSEDRLVTQLLRLKHIPVEDVRPIVAPLLSSAQALVTHKDSNLIVLTENALNVERIVRILREIDTPVKGKTVFTRRLKHAFAAELVKQVTEVLEKRGSAKEQPETRSFVVAKPVLLADERSNTVILICLKQDRKELEALIDRFDVDRPFAPTVKVFRLHHADATNLKAQVETALRVGKSGANLEFSVVADARSQSLLVSAYSQGVIDNVAAVIAELDRAIDTSERSDVHVYRLEFAEAEVVAELLGKVAEGFREGKTKTAGQVETKTSIIADKGTNSLVIQAEPDDYRELVEVIRKLDMVRPQVLVEVLIAEIDLNRARSLGLDFNFLDTDSGRDENRPFAIGNTDNLESLAGGGFPNGLNVGILTGRSFDFSAAAGGDASELSKIAVLIQAFQSTSKVKILSAPRLLTADNEEAKITVGERIQVPSGLTTAANTGLNTITSFSSEDLGIILSVTPRITNNDHVVLKVKQTIKSRSNETLYSFNIPVIKNRELDTSVTIPDRTTLVLGGLISEQVNVVESRIPIVSRIPLLGKLFRDREKVRSKTNLLVFLTPRIIRDGRTARQISQQHGRALLRDWRDERERKPRARVDGPASHFEKPDLSEKPDSPGNRDPFGKVDSSGKSEPSATAGALRRESPESRRESLEQEVDAMFRPLESLFGRP